MNKADAYLIKQISTIIKNGCTDKNPRPKYEDGTPAHTLSINGNFRRYNIYAGEFPITSLRPIAWKSAIKEILWIYQDQSNDLNVLRDKYNTHYWDLWESKDVPNTIGARYGEVVRRYKLIDNLLKSLIEDPYNRRHVIDLYQYKELNETDGLYPCAFCTIWNVRNDESESGKKFLDLTLIQRSGDLITASCSGVNEIQYTALLMMIARHCGYEPGMLYHYVANEQIYDRHYDAAIEILKRYRNESQNVYKEENYPKSPVLKLNEDKKDFYSFTIDDFTLENYEPMKPQLKLDLGI